MSRVVLLLFTAALGIAALPLTHPVGAEEIEGIAAIVGDQVILRSEHELAAQLLMQRLSARGDVPPTMLAQLHDEALQTLIDTKLILEFARRRQMNASDPEIDQAVEGIAQDEGTDPDGVYAAAALQGLSRTAYREELGTQITRMRVISSVVRARVTVGEDEIRALFKERYSGQTPGVRVRVRHILIPWPDDPTDEKHARIVDIAEEIRERAIETGAFAQLARQFSRAPSAMDGGLATFKKGEVAPEIATYVFELPAGEVTPVIETSHGVNIFQIINRFDPADIDYADVSEELHAELLDRKLPPEYDRWVKALREDQYIHVVNGSRP